MVADRPRRMGVVGGRGGAQCQILLVPLLLLAGKASAKNGLVLISPPSGAGGGGELQEDSFRISAKYARVHE